MRVAAPLALLAAAAGVAAQEGAARSGYGVARATAGAASLLAANEEAWDAAQRIAWGPRAYETSFQALWGDAGLFIRFDVTDPDPWNTLTRRDDRLWNEEVVEVFLEPGGSGRSYAELEINPANVVCDLWVDKPAEKYDAAWDLAGLESRVHRRRDAAGGAAGWTAVAFLPWTGFASAVAARGTALPPHPGDRWRFNVFRIERPGGKEDPERDALYLAWSPTGQKTFHVPEAFRDMTFLQ